MLKFRTSTAHPPLKEYDNALVCLADPHHSPRLHRRRLMMLRDTAKKLPLTDEQLRKVHERNAEADAKDNQDR